jgi:soluble lytic murein transglycosylase-like protein
LLYIASETNQKETNRMKNVLLVVTLATCVTAPAAARQLSGAELRGAGLSRSGKIVISNDEHSIRVSQRDREVLKVRATRVASNRTLSRVVSSKPAVRTKQVGRKLDSNVPAALAPIIQAAAYQHGIDPRLLAAVARRESRFRPNAVSPVGAQGVMQLMPKTAKWLGVEDSLDPRQNIFGGAKYLKMMLDQFDGNVELSLAAYNAGPGAVKKYRGVPPYRETRQYVAAIRSDYESSTR